MKVIEIENAFFVYPHF